MKPILLAMTNPQSVDPRRALWPAPAGCSGYRLWKMVEAACGMAAAEYVETFDRRNLLKGEWLRPAAVEAACKFRQCLQIGSNVVVFGAETWSAFHFNSRPPVFASLVVGGSRFYYLHHPSGLCQFYNEPAHRARAGALLAGLSRRVEQCVA